MALIDSTLAGSLIATQFPLWKNLSIRPVKHGGWDNKTFHLGMDMTIRMPTTREYALQVEKEQKWLPKLAPFLPLSIPQPVAIGEPGHGYPWKWSIYRWIEGDIASVATTTNSNNFASTLAQFLIALQQIDTTNGPLPGEHNFFRGGKVATYDTEVRRALIALKDNIDVNTAIDVWETALLTSWQKTPVWIHGDVSAGNLLVQQGHLHAVIDFGMLGIGDPACDLATAWTLFDGESQTVFREEMAMDENSWSRGRGWALWKALVEASGISKTNTQTKQSAMNTIQKVLKEYKS